ncbi:transposase [Flavobacteriaceae bacterium TP-CH-4]|uniref:Transposase n=1 Tax=Pelagihabitans pacificus TaxID=2696054 RepID=A0A967AZF2_9FLAO|nr:integrase core domain-containing protein [Pelagihabitans pacificus]NHF60372.1 transposase [Pelagihabitans pacificus]
MDLQGKSLAIRVDNGLEFLSRVFVNYCEVEDIEIKYIQPGKPSQNGYIERFDRTYREDVLDAHLFRDIEEVNMETQRFRQGYNRFHLHKSLGRSSPKEYLEEF